MAVDVSYQGLVLSRGAEVKQTPGGLFVALEAPMPVGTKLLLDEGGQTREVRVVHVHEGVGPGVIVAGAEMPRADAVVAAENVPQHHARPDETVPTNIHDAVTAPLPARERPTEAMEAVSPQKLAELGAQRGSGDGAVHDDGRRTIEMKALTPEQLEEMAKTVPNRAAPDEPKDDEPSDKSGGGRRKRKKTRTG